jgi:hypothetical protein
LNLWQSKKEAVVVDFGNTASVILGMFLIITILVAGVVLAAVFMSLTGGFGFAVRIGHSNVFRSVTKGELAIALFAALALAAVAVVALRRL